MKFFPFVSLRRGRGGFTLTELMVVVIIVGILAVLGMSSYSKAVEKAKFSDGVTMLATVSEAYARYYYEMGSAPTLFSQLDISLGKGTTSGASFTGTNFSVQFDSTGLVKVIPLGLKGESYSLCTYAESVCPFCLPVCCGTKSFCQSVGYTSDYKKGSCQGWIKP